MAEKNSKTKNAESTPKATGTKTTTSKDTTAKKAESSAKATTSAKSTTAKASVTKAESTKATSSKATAEKAETKKTATTEKTTSNSKATNASKTTTANKSTKATTATTKAVTKATATKDTAKVTSGTKSSIAKETKAETKATNNVVAKASSASKTEPKSTSTKVEAKATENKTATKTSAKTSNKIDSKADTNVTSKSSTKADIKTAEQPKAATAKAETKNTVKADNKAVADKTTTKASVTTTDSKTTKKVADKAQTKKAENTSAKDEVVASKTEDNKAEKSKIDFSAMFAFGKKNKAEENVEQNAKKPKANNDNKQNNQKVSFKDKMVAMVAGKNKQENTSTATKATANTNGQGKTTFVDFFKGNKIRLFAIIALALFLMFIFILSISLGVVNANKNKLPSNSSQSIKSDSITTGSTYDYEYRTTATAGYNAEILGYVDRKIPTEVSYESASGLAEKYYPKYGYTPQGMSDASLRQKLVNEAIQLCTIHTRIGSDGYPKNTYDKMDKDGNLYLNGQRVTGSPNKLYKHISSVGMYFGDISNDEKAVIKKMTFNPRSFLYNNNSYQEMYNVTGLYAPAGEVIKVEISKDDMERTGGVLIHIGQALYNRKANNIWVAKGQMQRFPVILNSMMITKNTAEYDAEKDVYVGYIGSFLGGPIYVTNSNASFHRITTSFSMTISGGVTYSHFILGHTTPEEFDANKDSTVPYFDLEVWDNGVLHSGPKIYAQNYSYDDLYKVAVLWDKITSVTTYGYNQNIVFLYDPFVAAGAAVAFPTQGAVNCPGSWMANSLNYEGLRKSGGWGNLHEYHHNFQGYGVGAGGEVTNNALTLVSYALFTQISSSRQMGNFGATGLGGWNRYTVATWALEQVKRIQNPNQNPENGNKGLSLYATLLHNFGPDAFMQVRKLGGGQSYQNYFKKWEQVTHYNMTYYFSEMLRANEVQPGTITAEWLKANSNPNYPMFVPVSSVYQTGRGYNYDNVNKFNKTMQPYVIAYGQDFTIDLSPYTLLADGNHKSGSIVLPEGFSYKVKSITQPENGVITRIGNDNYLYNLSPNDKLMTGEIYVTLEITKDDNAFVVEDVDLILEFEQSHELTGRMLERTTYNFEGETKYTSAKDAFINGYAGNTGVIKGDNKNTTQNSNTDIWMTTDEANEAASHNSVMEVKGKFLISETGKYRFQIRGRYNVALFLAVNEIPEKNSDFKYSCEYIQKGTNTGFPTQNSQQIEGTYIELDLKYGDWVYLRAVMIAQNSPRGSFIGVGMGKVPDPMPQVDDNGNPLLDSDGNPLPDIQNPTTISYATAYRESYQPAENHFNPEYYYNKNLVYSYKETNQQVIDTKQTIVETNYKPHNANSNKIENLVDGDKNTYIFTTNNSFSETNPLYFVAKFDQPITASVFTIHLRKSTNGHQRPKKLKLYISSNGTDWDLIINTVASDNLPQSLQQFEFNKLYTFQYYKLAIESSFNNYDIFITELEFTYKFLLNNGTQLALGDKNLKLTGSWDIQNVISKFGRVYVGKTNSAIQFEFTGNRLLLLSVLENNNFEVYIDGKKVNSMDFEKTDTAYKPSYISPELEIKTHSVIIKCLGESNFESIVIYKS